MEGSNGKIIELLDRIAAGQAATRDEMREGFDKVSARLDNVVGFLGRHHADHEQRLTALEAHVFKKPEHGHGR